MVVRNNEVDTPTRLFLETPWFRMDDLFQRMYSMTSGTSAVKDIPENVRRSFYRDLSRKYHPDNNGDTAMMMYVNKLKSILAV